jgi:rod shape-determining protein MreC
MPRVLSPSKPYLLLFLLLSLNLILMAASVRAGRDGSLLQQAVLTIASPFLKVASWISSGTAGIWTHYADLRSVEQENRRLRATVGTLTLEAHAAEETRQEVRRLRDLLRLSDEVGAESVVAARVIARGATGTARTLLIDAGSRQGVAVNQPVLATRGVVGRVIEAAPGVSKIQSILDPNSGVAALLQRTRVQGVLVGEGEETCRLEFVGEAASVEIGDVVVTSGLDEIYPKGRILGLVVTVGESQGLTRYVQVRPEVDLRRLEEVLVVKSSPMVASGAEP